MPKFEGVAPAIITPMTSGGEINEEAFRVLMEDNIQAGVHGFWVAGGSGESVLLTDDENRRIATASVDQNQGRTTVIMHVGAQTTVRAARNAEHAARAGVDAICAVPPFFFRPGAKGIVEYYRTVAAAADLPLFVYNLPQSTGVEITVDLMQKIQDDIPQLTGLKHSALDMNVLYRFVHMGLKVYTGSGGLMLPALTIGAVGCIDGPPCLVPEVWVEIWNAYKARDLERAEAAQVEAAEAMMFLVDRGYFAPLKTLCGERIGIDCGDPRPPHVPLTSEQKAELIRDAHRAGVLSDRVAPPGD